MVIGLMGFEFVSPNKGCEALVYSFLSMIMKDLKDDTVIYNFSGTDLGAIPEYFSKWQFINVIPRLKDIKFQYIRSMMKCDYIFDVTMGDSFSDIYSESYCKGLIRHKRIAEFFCDKYILLPQTYGPFEDVDCMKKAGEVLKKAYKIYCRDGLSKTFIEKKYHISNSVLASDMAFCLPYNKFDFQFGNDKKLGLNVSGLLYKGGFHKENQFGLKFNYQEFLDRLLTELQKMYEVHLIPHVIDLNENSYDDDYKICRMLNSKYPNTILAPAFSNPIDAKSYISNMDAFIGSRMHSTIASFSAGVPTIPISYSRKFEGLFGSIDYPYVIDAKKESFESAFKMVFKYLSEIELLHDRQKKSLEFIDEKNESFKRSIIEIIKGGV